LQSPINAEKKFKQLKKIHKEVDLSVNKFVQYIKKKRFLMMIQANLFTLNQVCCEQIVKTLKALS
jgi:hypothetical protein